MRAVAILLVLASHFGLGNIVPGGFGVTLFFFISGFLITRLLIAEYNNEVGQVAIGAFYIRRFLRLGPALVAMLFCASLSYYFLVGPINPWELSAAVFYSINYYSLYFAISMPLQVLWSLAVEEHYYAVYPVTFAYAWKYGERFIVGLIVVTAAVLLWRLYLVYGTSTPIWRLYYRTDTRIDSILYGAILAGILEIERYNWIVARLGSVKFVALGFSILGLTFVYRDDIFRETARYTLQGVALLPVFYSILFVERFALFRRILEIRPMLWIGRLSYSLYLWHMVVTFWVDEAWPSKRALSHIIVALPLSFLVAAVLGILSHRETVSSNAQSVSARRRGKTSLEGRGTE